MPVTAAFGPIRCHIYLGGRLRLFEGGDLSLDGLDFFLELRQFRRIIQLLSDPGHLLTEFLQAFIEQFDPFFCFFIH